MRFTPFAFIGKEYQVIDIQYLIVGGGGAAGQEDIGFQTGAGGGGAGQFISGSTSLVLNPELSFAVIVGTGGTDPGASYTRGLPGNPSSFLGLTAIGGGGGGARQQLSGGDGASGGGGTYLGSSTGGGGTGTAGFNGASAFYSTQPSPIGTFRSGCGGGAATTASAPNLTTDSIPGQPKAWLDGNVYAGGGNTDGQAAAYFYISGSGGTGNTSAISDVLPGRNGIVKIRYAGTTSLFNGGEIAVSGGYVYHTFPSSSALIPVVQN